VIVNMHGRTTIKIVYLHCYLTTARIVGERSVSRPSAFTPGNKPFVSIGKPSGIRSRYGHCKEEKYILSFLGMEFLFLGLSAQKPSNVRTKVFLL
jgi:hypothetical protein